MTAVLAVGAPQLQVDPWSGFAVWEWVLFAAVAVFQLWLEFLANRRPDPDPPIKKSALLVGICFGVAAASAVYLFVAHGDTIGMQYTTGFLSEYSLSIDNLLAWQVMIFGVFNIWPGYQAHLIRVGMLISIAIRVVMLIFGVQAVQSWWWFAPLVLGPILFIVTVKLFWEALKRHHDKIPKSFYEGRVYRWFRWIICEDTYGTAFFAVERGRRRVTVYALVGLAFVVLTMWFSMDSVPIMTTLSQSMFVVVFANVQSMLGLTSMYFLYARISARFRLLKYFLPVILAWMLIKTYLGADMHHGIFASIAWEEWHPHDWVSLVVVAGLIGLGIALSLVFPPKQTQASA